MPLPDGTVLVAGGRSFISRQRVAETRLYDPAKNCWMGAGNLAEPRGGATATILDGGVFVIGGKVTVGAKTVEVFNIATRTWSAGPPLTRDRQRHVTAPVGLGRLMTIGSQDDNGVLAGANGERFIDGGWVYDGRASNRYAGAGLALRDGGGALFTGGCIDSTGTCISSALTQRWVASSSDSTGVELRNQLPMQRPRGYHSMTELKSGAVFVAGGRDNNGTTGTAEIFDGTNWTLLSATTDPRLAHGSALLNDGRVFLVGGFNVKTAVIFDPATNTFSPTFPVSDAGISDGGNLDWEPTATLLNNGRVLVLGGVVLLFDPADGGWSPAY